MLFNKSSFEKLLQMNDYIEAVSMAHKMHALGNIIEPDIVHADAPNGEYHIKTGGILGDKPYYGLKANGGFFNNSVNFQLPNILGVIYLSDASNAYPLAIFESSLISKMRTAAATAVAAKYLAPKSPIKLGIIGYGNQAAAHLESLSCVRQIESVSIAGRNSEKVNEFVEKYNGLYDFEIKVDTIENTCRNSNVLITTTTSKNALVKKEWIKSGTFIGAIGADSPGKNELDIDLVASSKIVGDIKRQIIKVGECQHAIKQGLIKQDDIYAELGELIVGKVDGRTNDSDIFIYDSTGTALQDVACAAYIYEKLKDNKDIKSIDLFS